MSNVRAKFWLLSLLLVFVYCGSNQQPEATDRSEVGATSWVQTPEEYRRHLLPADIRQKAPQSQNAYYKILRFAGPNFKLKPSFVITEEGQQQMGPLDPLATRLDFVYLHCKQPQWSASVIWPRGKGTTAFFKQGYRLDITPTDAGYQLRLQDGDKLSWQVDAPRGQFHLDTNRDWVMALAPLPHESSNRPKDAEN